MQEAETRESTSLKIRPSVWKKAKVEAICDDVELSVFVEDAVIFWTKRRKEFQK